VLNLRTYPSLLKFYKEIGVKLEETDMSFAICNGDNAFNGKFSSRKSEYFKWLREKPSEVIAFLWSKARFHRAAMKVLDDERAYRHVKLAAWIDEQQLAPVFVDGWLRPFCAAVWSLDQEHVDSMDIIALLVFLSNHGFLSWSTFKWFIPAGRSISEVRACEDWLRARTVCIVADVTVDSVEKQSDSKMILVGHKSSDGSKWKLDRSFDVVVFATPAPITLNIVSLW
jgi:predicted NAD/FAD-binding protein